MVPSQAAADREAAAPSLAEPSPPVLVARSDAEPVREHQAEDQNAQAEDQQRGNQRIPCSGPEADAEDARAGRLFKRTGIRRPLGVTNGEGAKAAGEASAEEGGRERARGSAG